MNIKDRLGYFDNSGRDASVDDILSQLSDLSIETNDSETVVINLLMDDNVRSDIQTCLDKHDRAGVFPIIQDSAKRANKKITSEILRIVGQAGDNNISIKDLNNTHSIALTGNRNQINRLFSDAKFIDRISLAEMDNRIGVPEEQTEQVDNENDDHDFVAAAGYVVAFPSPSWWTADTSIDSMHARGFKGRGINIAICDSGIDPSLPAGNCLKEFARFSSNGSTVTNNLSDAVDSGCHGSKVAGLINLCAPSANLIVVRALDGFPRREGGTTVQLSAALGWLVSQQANAISNNPSSNYIDIINLSLDVKNRFSTLSAAITILSQLGVIPVVAIGNRGAWSRSSIADDGLSIGAIDINGHAWLQSCSNPHIVAPGVSIECQQPSLVDFNYATHGVYHGTSFSAAITSGSLAVLMSAVKRTNEGDYKNSLLLAAKSISGLKRRDDRMGWGPLNVKTAFDILSANPAGLPAFP